MWNCDALACISLEDFARKLHADSAAADDHDVLGTFHLRRRDGIMCVWGGRAAALALWEAAVWILSVGGGRCRPLPPPAHHLLSGGLQLWLASSQLQALRLRVGAGGVGAAGRDDGVVKGQDLATFQCSRILAHAHDRALHSAAGSNAGAPG